MRYLNIISGLMAFSNMQVPFGTKMAIFFAISQTDGASRLSEHCKLIFCSSYTSYCSYLRPPYKFHHQHVPDIAKTLGAVSQVEKLEPMG